MLTTAQHAAVKANRDQFGKDIAAATAMHRSASAEFGHGRNDAAYWYGHQRAYAMEINAQIDQAARRAEIFPQRIAA